MARIQTSIPKAVINHHNHELSADAKSVEFFTMSVHFARDNPNPDNAPYLAAMVWQKHIRSRNPIQLNKKAVRKAVKKTKSFPNNSDASTVESPPSNVSPSKDGNDKSVKPGGN